MKKIELWALVDEYGRIYQSASTEKLANDLKESLNIKGAKIIKLEGLYE